MMIKSTLTTTIACILWILMAAAAAIPKTTATTAGDETIGVSSSASYDQNRRLLRHGDNYIAVNDNSGENGMKRTGTVHREKTRGSRNLKPKSEKKSKKQVKTDAPSDVPSDFPSSFPSEVPSLSPSGAPSDFPSSLPSDAPTSSPSDIPTFFPTESPSDSPSDSPSSSPTVDAVSFACHTDFDEPNILIQLSEDITCSGKVRLRGKDQVLDCGGNTITETDGDFFSVMLVLAGGATVRNCNFVNARNDAIQIDETQAAAGSTGVYLLDQITVSGVDDDALQMVAFTSSNPEVTITNSEFIDNDFGLFLDRNVLNPGQSLEITLENITVDADDAIVFGNTVGDVDVTMNDVTVTAESDGIVLSLEGPGSFEATLDRITTVAGADGLQLVLVGAASLESTSIAVSNSEFCDNGNDVENAWLAVTDNVQCTTIIGDNADDFLCAPCL